MAHPTVEKVRTLLRDIPDLIEKEIWLANALTEQSARGKTFAILRFLAITGGGVRSNRIPSQAAALSYYTLIALGPMIAIAIMISGFVFQDNQEEIAVKTLTKLVYFIAPSAEKASERELEQFFDEVDSEALTSGEATLDLAKEEVNLELVNFITEVVQNARSGAVGIIGSFILIVICIQLMSTIEKTFNTIWGVRDARPLFQQIVFYWTFITLGAVVGFASITLGIYQKTAEVFEHVPFASMITGGSTSWIAPVLSFGIITLLLTLFNRAIPNTTVRWWPAMAGALVVTAMLFLNKSLTFLYVGVVIRQQSLFGSVGILPVLLFGLFVFWLFLLLGGQITYSVQNVNNLSNQRIWDNISLRMQETLSLIQLVLIARRFHECQPPLSNLEIAEKLRAPGHIVNASLSKLCDMGYITPIRPPNLRDEMSLRYHPAKPLIKMTLGNFKRDFEIHGNNEGIELFSHTDPVMKNYFEHLLDYDEIAFAKKTFPEILDTESKENTKSHPDK